MTTPKKPGPKLRVLSFPSDQKKPQPVPSPAEQAGMGLRFVELTVTAQDAERVIDFLNAHLDELPPTAPNLLGLVWSACRTMISRLELPPESVEVMAGMMVQRACNWVNTEPEKPKPTGRKK